MKIAQLFLFISLCIFYVSCKPTASESAPIEDLYSTDIPNSFMDFLEKFSQDSLYQLDHILFPLQGVSAEYPNQKHQWTRENWTTHQSFSDHNGTFSRSFKNLNGIIIENTSAVGTSFNMERRFSKMGDQWTLIYYNEMHDTSGSFK